MRVSDLRGRGNKRGDENDDEIVTRGRNRRREQL